MKLSMMQGRLVPPVDNQIQFYPVNNWEEEFVLAKKLGLYSIEWIYEKKNANLNALSTKLGVEKIKSIIKETGVQVKSICADYFMEELLLNNGAIVKKISSIWNGYVIKQDY